MICAYHRYTEVGTNSTNSHHVHLQTIDQPVHHIHHSAWDLCYTAWCGLWTLAPPNSSNTQTSKQLNNQLCPCEVMAWCEFHAPPSPEFVNPQQNGKIIDTTRMRSTLKKIIQQENHWHKKKPLNFSHLPPCTRTKPHLQMTGRSTHRSGWSLTPGPSCTCGKYFGHCARPTLGLRSP